MVGNFYFYDKVYGLHIWNGVNLSADAIHINFNLINSKSFIVYERMVMMVIFITDSQNGVWCLLETGVAHFILCKWGAHFLLQITDWNINGQLAIKS